MRYRNQRRKKRCTAKKTSRTMAAIPPTTATAMTAPVSCSGMREVTSGAATQKGRNSRPSDDKKNTHATKR